ncbi:proton-coupled amino acid transporter-like protein CG1139 [Anabrus simplex]|uniref:proton-coupled amino acid transporter-like protein CG1139 n=1 Tax=Anabrus simplex TaxID=316456 RepID=UPI0034DD2FD2
MSHDNMAFSDPPTQLEMDPTDYGSRKSEQYNLEIEPVYHQSTPPYGANDSSYQEKKLPLSTVFVIQDGLKPPKDDDYLPHQNREVEHPTTNCETLLHLLKGSLGTGILAMPLAFYHAGYAVGVVGTILIGLVCTYCIHLLIKAEYELCKRRRIPSLNYPETAEAALEAGPGFFSAVAPYAGHVVNIFLLIYQLGTCCVYVVFVATNIQAVMDQYVGEIDVRIYMLILLLPLILINWVRNLKLLAPFSTLANILTLVGFGITIYYLFDTVPELGDKSPIGSVQNMPLFFGTVLFALEAIGVILPLENNMKTPKSFGGPVGVLNKAMFVIILLYVGIGFLGYMRFGSEVAGSITLNLPKDEILAQSVKIMLAVAIFITHGLQCYVAVDITWNQYLAPRAEKFEHQLLLEYGVRTFLVLLTFSLAVAIPDLELFISLFGALCLSALGIAFPAIIDMAVFWDERSGCGFWVMLLKNLFLVLFAVLGLVTGSYISLKEIVHKFS